MHPSKGFDLLQQAWDEMESPNCKLHIITNPSGGENNYFNKNKAWSQTKENVHWHEGLTQQEVKYYLCG